MKKITLCVTSLNPDEALLNKMLRSAVGFDEILLHIDAATVKYPRIDFNMAGSPVRMIHHPEHLEVGPAYDMVIEQADSEWICVFFDDDYFDLDGLAGMLADFRRGIDADVAHFRCAISGYMPKVDRRGIVFRFFKNIVGPYLKKKHLWMDIKYLFGFEEITIEKLEEDNALPAGSFFRKSVWERVGGFKGEISHDWIFWLRAARLGCKFKFFDHVVYHYVRRENSAWFRQLRSEAKNDWHTARDMILKEATIAGDIHA